MGELVVVFLILLAVIYVVRGIRKDAKGSARHEVDQETIKDVEKANEAAANVNALSDDDVVVRLRDYFKK